MKFLKNPFNPINNIRKNEIIGYTAGVFDLFHIGHLNLLKSAKGLCSRLIVGVTIDEIVQYKGKSPVIPFVERIEIVRALRFVDSAIPQEVIDKFEMWNRVKFDILFVGDDWYENKSWIEYESKLASVGVKVIYLPYTKNTSSTLINQTLNLLRSKQ